MVVIYDRTSPEGRELIAPLSRLLCLPASSTFEHLQPSCAEETVHATDTFSSHQIYRLPCDHQCVVNPGHGAAMADTLHRFEVRDCHLMNEALAKWSLTIEKEDDENVQKSNWGG